MAQTTIVERWMIDSLIELREELENNRNAEHNMEDSTKGYFIQYTNEEWMRASPHHITAYKEYINTINKLPGQLIEVPHSRGGNFVAWFFETDMEGVFRFINEYNDEVHIKMQ